MGHATHDVVFHHNIIMVIDNLLSWALGFVIAQSKSSSI
jgi:hypothetical protein